MSSGDTPRTDEFSLCGMCDRPITNIHGGIRHFGFFNAHDERDCIRILKADLARLTEENEALRKDKERLDWLEDPDKCYWFKVYSQPSGKTVVDAQGKKLRDAIDAAIKEGS